MTRQSTRKRYQPREPLTTGDRRHESHKLFSMTEKANPGRRAFLPKEFLPGRQATDDTTVAQSKSVKSINAKSTTATSDKHSTMLPPSDSEESCTSFRSKGSKVPHSIDLESLVISQPGSQRDQDGYDDFGSRSGVHDLNIQIIFPNEERTPDAPQHKKGRRKYVGESKRSFYRSEEIDFGMKSQSNTLSTPPLSRTASNSSCGQSNPTLTSLSRQISPTPSETQIAHQQHHPHKHEKPHGRRHSLAGKQNHRGGDWRRKHFLQEKKTHDFVENVDDCLSPTGGRGSFRSPKTPATAKDSTGKLRSGGFRSVFDIFGSKKGALLDDASPEQTPVRTKDPTFAMGDSSARNISRPRAVRKKNSI